jgi:nitroimidazol reductase NimA-like FMN-containing flavoprotein (pyridoxamine 5'-phosphate oxidase superfamily)
MSRTTLQRHPERGLSETDAAYAILDEAFICHVGFVDTGPVVIPTTYTRVGNRLYLHGSPRSRMMNVLRYGSPVSVAVTLLDGLVLETSGFNHSMNYRSVVIFGRAAEVTDPSEKRRVLDAIVEHLIPDRLRHLRPMTDKEVDATMVIAVPLDEVSVKSRQGPPEHHDDWPVWTGVLPLRLTSGAPERFAGEVAEPDHVTRFVALHMQ